MIIWGDTPPQKREHEGTSCCFQFQDVDVACDGSGIVHVDGDIYTAVMVFIAWDEATFWSRLDRMEAEHEHRQRLAGSSSCIV